MNNFIKKFLIPFISTFIIWFTNTYIVKAASYTANYTGYVNGQYQYEYKSRVKSYVFNDIDSYFSMNNQDFIALDGLHLTFDFSTNVQNLDFPPIVYDQTAYIVIDYCSTGLTIYDAYSSYYNYIDYSYTVKPNSCYASSQYKGDYKRIFLRKTSGFSMNFITGVYTVEATSFGINNDTHHNPLGRFLAATLYDASDYNLLLENAKKGTENQIIINQIERDNNYTNEGETPEGKEDMDDLKEQEGQLIDSIDLSGAEDIDITINPETNNFIWNIVERLRGMNSAIVTLITSVLGMGIIKMILNR